MAKSTTNKNKIKTFLCTRATMIHNTLGSNSRMALEEPLQEWVGESMVFYTKTIDEKKSSLKRNSFSQKHKKVNSIFT